MLERNRLQPPRSSAPSQTAGWADLPVATGGGLFASAEDYDATGILAGVDPCESRYWWMPELFTSANPAVEAMPNVVIDTTTKPAEEPASAGQRRSGLAERLLHPGQATRRAGSRNTAAA
ncbi:MAG: hypothetical protein ACKOK8_15100 [Planctomycetia bacterium]